MARFRELMHLLEGGYCLRRKGWERGWYISPDLKIREGNEPRKWSITGHEMFDCDDWELYNEPDTWTLKAQAHKSSYYNPVTEVVHLSEVQTFIRKVKDDIKNLPSMVPEDWCINDVMVAAEKILDKRAGFKE